MYNYNRVVGHSSTGKHCSAKKFCNRNKSICQDALEIPQESLHYDSSLGVRFDRNISFEVGGDLGANVVLLATLVTSRRHERLSGDSRLASDPSVKFAQVDHATHNVGRGVAPVPKPADIELNDFLKTTC